MSVDNLLSVRQTVIELFESMMSHLQVPQPQGVPAGAVKAVNRLNRQDYAAHFHIEIRADNHGYARDGSYHRNWERTYCAVVHLILMRGLRVYAYVDEQPHHRPGIPDADLFHNTSNHDSCWRTDGLSVIVDTYFKAVEHCWGNVAIPPDQKLSPREADVNASLMPLGFKKPVSLVYATRRPLTVDETVGKVATGYFDKLLEIEEVPFHIVAAK